MLVKLYRICCDYCGTTTAPYATSKEARAGAIRAYRWRRVAKRGDTPARDVCPRCSR